MNEIVVYALSSLGIGMALGAFAGGVISGLLNMRDSFTNF